MRQTLYIVLICFNGKIHKIMESVKQNWHFLRKTPIKHRWKQNQWKINTKSALFKTENLHICILTCLYTVVYLIPPHKPKSEEDRGAEDICHYDNHISSQLLHFVLSMLEDVEEVNKHVFSGWLLLIHSTKRFYIKWLYVKWHVAYKMVNALNRFVP